jgi:class 3 adenylate cyclase
MMTDIVGSTARAVAVGDGRWRRILERHDQTTRAMIAGFTGTYVKSLGDGLLATFDRPDRAVACARELRDALAELDLSVRIGLHAGEVELLGDDIAGITVNIAGRICALAGGDEILVSEAVRDLADLSDMKFWERGVHQLRSVPSRWTLYAVD